MTVDCVFFRPRGAACLHAEAPKGFFLLASCIVANPDTQDPRRIHGCKWVQAAETVASMPYEMRTPEDGQQCTVRR
jgi:hypothetical protein